MVRVWFYWYFELKIVGFSVVYYVFIYSKGFKMYILCWWWIVELIMNLYVLFRVEFKGKKNFYMKVNEKGER